jgi:hypothetical protein
MPAMDRSSPKLQYATTPVPRKPISLAGALLWFIVMILIWGGIVGAKRFIELGGMRADPNTVWPIPALTDVPTDAQLHPERDLSLGILSFGGALAVGIQAIRLQNKNSAV